MLEACQLEVVPVSEKLCPSVRSCARQLEGFGVGWGGEISPVGSFLSFTGAGNRVGWGG